MASTENYTRLRIIFNKIKILLKFCLRQICGQPKGLDLPGFSESRFSPSFFPKGFVLFNLTFSDSDTDQMTMIANAMRRAAVAVSFTVITGLLVRPLCNPGSNKLYDNPQNHAQRKIHVITSNLTSGLTVRAGSARGAQRGRIMPGC